jgi:hypothetical protein
VDPLRGLDVDIAVALLALFFALEIMNSIILSNTEVSQRDFSFAILTTLVLRHYCLGICQRRSHQNPQSSATSLRVFQTAYVRLFTLDIECDGGTPFCTYSLR